MNYDNESLHLATKPDEYVSTAPITIETGLLHVNLYSIYLKPSSICEAVLMLLERVNVSEPIGCCSLNFKIHPDIGFSTKKMRPTANSDDVFRQCRQYFNKIALQIFNLESMPNGSWQWPHQERDLLPKTKYTQIYDNSQETDNQLC